VRQPACSAGNMQSLGEGSGLVVTTLNGSVLCRPVTTRGEGMAVRKLMQQCIKDGASTMVPQGAFSPNFGLVQVKHTIAKAATRSEVANC
jgi:hypothetical protein